MTGEDGLYIFDKLPAGKYAGQISTVPNGLAEAFELDNVRDGIATVKLASGQDVVEVDLGLTPAGSIGNLIFLDANGDGKQTGNKGISEVTVELIAL